MRQTHHFLAVIVAVTFASVMFFTGCGGNAGPATQTSMPTPAPPSSGGSGSGGSGSGGSGSGGGASSTPSVQWSSTMDRVASGGTASGSGKVTVASDGTVSLQFSGGTPNASYDAQFCPFPFVAPPNQCFTLKTITADASGAGTLNMAFPKKGNWAGNFYVHSSADYFNTADANLHGSASMPLVPASGVSGNAPSQMSQDPLTSGTVTMDNGSVTVTVKGATPNATYTVTQYTDATMSSAAANLLTDSSGNGTVTFSSVTLPSPDLTVERTSNGQAVASGFVNGFKVP